MRYFILIYTIFVVFFSLWLHRLNTNIYEYFSLVIGTILFLLAIPYVFKGFQEVGLSGKFFKIFLVALIIIIIAFSVLYSTISGTSLYGCSNVVARNIFTGKTRKYCNFPPWYIKPINFKMKKSNNSKLR